MEATDSHSLEWKKNEAWLAHDRRLETDPTERYRVPIYHIGLISYLRWTIASLLPNPIDTTPIKLGHVDYEKCVIDYGRHRPLSDINSFLQDLLDDKFTTAFGFRSGIVDYQYLVDKISDIIADQQEREGPIPRGLARAEIWLNEQIALLKAARSISTLAVPSVDEQPFIPPGSSIILAPVESIKLTLRQVALLYIYQGHNIPTEASAIAQQYGHQSGRKLYDHFRKLTLPSQRMGVEGKTLAPMIADITTVIAHLTGAVRQQAESELRTLQAKE